MQSPNLGKGIADIPPGCQKLGPWSGLWQHLFSLGWQGLLQVEALWRKRFILMNMKLMAMVSFLGENCLQTSWGFKEIEIAFYISKNLHCILPCICTVLLTWGALERAADSAGSTLRSRQPKAASPQSREMPWETGICWILKLVGDRCQEPVSCRDDIYLGWVQRVSVTQFAGYPRFLSPTVGCPCHLWRQGSQWSWCSAVTSLTAAEPGSKEPNLFWAQEKLWPCFEHGGIFLIYSAQQLWEHEGWAGGERRVIHSCCPSRWFLAAQ